LRRPDGRTKKKSAIGNTGRYDWPAALRFLERSQTSRCPEGETEKEQSTGNPGFSTALKDRVEFPGAGERSRRGKGEAGLDQKGLEGSKVSQGPLEGAAALIRVPQWGKFKTGGFSRVSGTAGQRGPVMGFIRKRLQRK